jgi:D-glycero-D-manno-heptose 1,7-bisphosphate phosphatase
LFQASSLGDVLHPELFSTVFVDRDGVLNRKARKYVLSPAQLQLLPGSASAVKLLNRAGKRVYVVTNQRCVALGLLSADALEQIHASLREQLAVEDARLDGIYACPHDAGTCDCRKPQPGLLLQARREHPEIDFGRSVLVGDSVIDICAGQAAGCRTILVGRGRRRAEAMAELQRLARPPDATALSLLEAVRKLLVVRV